MIHDVITVFLHCRQYAIGILNHPVIEQLAGQLGLAYQPVLDPAEASLGLSLLGLDPPEPGQPALYLSRPMLGVPVVDGLREECP